MLTNLVKRNKTLSSRDPFLRFHWNIAEIADKFTRNEIMSSNEIRQVVGLSPHSDPKADKLINSNMPAANPDRTASNGTEDPTKVDLAPILVSRSRKDVQNGS